MRITLNQNILCKFNINRIQYVFPFQYKMFDSGKSEMLMLLHLFFSARQDIFCFNDKLNVGHQSQLTDLDLTNKPVLTVIKRNS